MIERSKESSEENIRKKIVNFWCHTIAREIFFTNKIFVDNILHSQTKYIPRLKTIIF